MADLNLTHVYYTKKTIKTYASYNKVRDKCVPCFSFYIKVIKLLINTTKYQPRSLARYSITYPHSLSLSLSLFMQNREMVTKGKILLFSLAVLGQLTVSFAEDRLLNPAKLKMFVDELPDMPRIIGFDMVSGEPKSKSLKIGMFKKKWVSFSLYFLFSSPVLLKPHIIFGKLVFFSCSLGFRQFFIFYFLYDRI